LPFYLSIFTSSLLLPDAVTLCMYPASMKLETRISGYSLQFCLTCRRPLDGQWTLDKRGARCVSRHCSPAHVFRHRSLVIFSATCFPPRSQIFFFYKIMHRHTLRCTNDSTSHFPTGSLLSIMSVPCSNKDFRLTKTKDASFPRVCERSGVRAAVLRRLSK
jgi:hypothetical protein